MAEYVVEYVPIISLLSGAGVFLYVAWIFGRNA